MTPTRVQLSRRKGWRMPPNTVKVCRPGIFGNPYRVQGALTAAQVVRMFEVDLRLAAAGSHHAPASFAKMFSEIKRLRGKNLACWCPLPKPGEPDICHAAVLLEIANTTGEARRSRSLQPDVGPESRTL
jgi:hypothetical protein